MAVTNLQHVGLEVPDIDRALSFYTDAGLERLERGNSGVARCAGRDQDQVVFVEGPNRKLHHVSFGTTEFGIAKIGKRLEDAGHTLLDAPNETPEPGIWVRDPDGVLVNIKVAEAAPSRGGPEALGDAPDWLVNVPGHYYRQGLRAAPPADLPAQPRRLGHILQFTPNVDRKIDFYTRLLGMKLADRVGDFIAFMYLDGGSDHHVVALAKSDGPGLHHASFEMGNIDEIGLNSARMLDKGNRHCWGFGRHVIGSNFFTYFRDPWDGLIEFFSDIDYIPAGYDWQARDWPLDDALYRWGPKMPDDFVTNFELVH
ncbi:MAG: catechol 2,3-dioxygenase-like lactoylglutathione lyase family enzyme [Alphaproteobacteria bacterium]|jgi:catechol 2,3-dioxygenase-like lactoylglutathione lyase family enzyme